MLGVVVIAFCVWSLLRPADRNDTPGTQDSSTADTPVSQPDSTESSDSGVTADSAAQDESPLSAPELTLYTTDLANNIGKIGYDEQQMVGGKTRLEMYRDPFPFPVIHTDYFRTPTRSQSDDGPRRNRHSAGAQQERKREKKKGRNGAPRRNRLTKAQPGTYPTTKRRRKRACDTKMCGMWKRI